LNSKEEDGECNNYPHGRFATIGLLKCLLSFNVLGVEGLLHFIDCRTLFINSTFVNRIDHLESFDLINFAVIVLFEPCNLTLQSILPALSLISHFIELSLQLCNFISVSNLSISQLTLELDSVSPL